jgi:hypothetical protein
MAAFSITYETWSPDAVEHGETDDQGLLFEGISLREAYDELRWEGYCEANEYPVREPRWLTFSGEADFLTGEITNKALHIPGSVTSSSKRRIARLFGCHL